jgi:calcium-dependent protein kinase
MLTVDPSTRPTAEEVLQELWIQHRVADRRVEQPLAKTTMRSLAKFAVSCSQTEEIFQYGVLSFIASQMMSYSETELLGQVFRALDKDGNGKLSQAELRSGIKEAGVLANIEDILEKCDADGNGYVDYTEFLTATINWKNSMSQNRLESAFEAFDLDNNGSISLSEIKQVLGSTVDDLNDEFWVGLFDDADTNRDGEIDFEEFMDLMRRRR